MPRNTTKKYIMVYDLEEYAEKIAKCHVNTLAKRISRGLLPTNHIVYKGKKGQRTVIEIIHGSIKCQYCERYVHASSEFNEKRRGYRASSMHDIQFNRELAAEICVKFDLSALKFYAMHGLK